MEDALMGRDLTDGLRGAAVGSDSSVSVRCDVESFDEVARMVSMLRGRRYEIVMFSAAQRDGGRWAIELMLAATPPGGRELLLRRLERLVGVISASPALGS